MSEGADEREDTGAVAEARPGSATPGPIDERLYRHLLQLASHDLQEPLRKIAVFADLLERGVADNRPDDVTYALEVIRGSSRRARRLVQDLLSYARSHNAPMEPESLDLRAVLDDVLSAISGAVIKSRAVLSVEVPQSTVRADRLLLYRLLLNLVSNALKHRHPDREPHVRISLDRLGADLRLKVSDNGVGFDQDTADTLFQPFRRLGAAGEGSGLGLAICRTITDRHGWSLAASGVPGEGAEMTVVIPAVG